MFLLGFRDSGRRQRSHPRGEGAFETSPGRLPVPSGHAEFASTGEAQFHRAVDDLLRCKPVTVIPQRELRNNVSDVLRRAEAGQHFTVTVDGRPVAQLGPLREPRRLAAGARLAELLATHPVDEDWGADLAEQRAEEAAGSADVW